MKNINVLLLLLIIPIFIASAQENSDENDFMEMSLEELMNIEIITVSKFKQDVTDAPGVVSIISAEEIKKFGALNLLEALERVPNLTFMSSYFAPDNIISVRGDITTNYNTHVLILINGRPSRETLFGGLDYTIFKAFPVDAIDRIEVIRGPGSVLYGSNAYSGVINIITNMDKTNHTDISATVGSFETINASIVSNTSKDDLNLKSAFSVFQEEGWANSGIDENGDPFSFDMGETNLGGLISGDYKNLNFTSFLSYSTHDHFGVLPRVVYPGPTGANRPFNTRQMQSARAFANVGYGMKHNENWNTDVNATFNLMNVRFSTPNGDFVGDSKDIILEATNYLNINDKINWVAGAYAYIQDGGAIIGEDDDRGVAPFSETWYSAYSQIDYSPLTNLKLIAGGQYNKVEGIDGTFVPRLGAIYKWKNFGTKILYGQAFRAPFEFENGLNDPPVLSGNPGLEPEVIGTFDAQLFYNSKKYQFAVTYFNSVQEDLISRTAPPDPSYANIGELEQSGIEFEAKVNIFEKLYVTGSFTTQANTLNDSIDNATHIPETSFKMGMAYNFWNSSSIGIFNTSFGEYPSVVGDNTAVPVNPESEGFNYLTANLRLNVFDILKSDIEDKLIVDIYAQNLLDETIYYPEYIRSNINSLRGRGGRAFYLKLIYSF